jgi:diaminopimelate decarboxylase
MNKRSADILASIAKTRGTPCYVYFTQPIRDRVVNLRDVFGGRFEISYAVKANPNKGLLRILSDQGTRLDVSSIGEFDRGKEAGFNPEHISFTGPGKRQFELEKAVSSGLGVIICESWEEITDIHAIARAQGVTQRILMRITPETVPRQFGLQMAGQASQFGFDEEVLDAVVPKVLQLDAVRLAGFHIYSAGNSLDHEAIIENHAIVLGIYSRICAEHDIRPETLIIGSGFGIPYFEGDEPLDIDLIAAALNPMLDGMKVDKRFSGTRFMLEIGRYLVGSDGYMLTSVIRKKRSREREIRICDAGFNNNLSAAGMMGTIMRRDWQFIALTQRDNPEVEEYLIAGPLCASFDLLGARVKLPTLDIGDILAVCSSGAYGVTASPVNFISHPHPAEFIVDESGGEFEILDVTES